jgi:hypothetical protein
MKRWASGSVDQVIEKRSKRDGKSRRAKTNPRIRGLRNFSSRFLLWFFLRAE